MSLTFALYIICFTTSIMIKILARVTRNKFPCDTSSPAKPVARQNQLPSKTVALWNQLPCETSSPAKCSEKVFFFFKNSFLIVLEQICYLWHHSIFHSFLTLKVVSATFLLVSFLCLKESTCETRKNVFYFTSNTLFILEIIKF